VDVEVGDRARVVEAVGGDPTATLELPSGVFTRLACGRLSPSDATGLSISGDAELGARVLENLAFTI
jgi:hypothetical protein